MSEDHQFVYVNNSRDRYYTPKEFQSMANNQLPISRSDLRTLQQQAHKQSEVTDRYKDVLLPNGTIVDNTHSPGDAGDDYLPLPTMDYPANAAGR